MFIGQKENYYAANIKKLSAKFYDQGEDEGEDWLPEGSYAKLIQEIANSVKMMDRVKFKRQVKEIIYGKENKSEYCEVITHDGQRYCGKKVISSLPLGILKANRVKFSPCLPEGHKRCIDRMGWGVMNKVILSFEKPFWKQNPEWLMIAGE